MSKLWLMTFAVIGILVALVIAGALVVFLVKACRKMMPTKIPPYEESVKKMEDWKSRCEQYEEQKKQKLINDVAWKLAQYVRYHIKHPDEFDIVDHNGDIVLSSVSQKAPRNFKLPDVDAIAEKVGEFIGRPCLVQLHSTSGDGTKAPYKVTVYKDASKKSTGYIKRL